jgi:hypothetical protein
MAFRRRFLLAYAVLGLAVAASGAAAWKASTMHRSKPLAPGAVLLVERFLGAIQQGDLVTACRLFDSYPACDPRVGLAPLKSYRVLPAEPAVDGVDVPATLNGEQALFTVQARPGGYRIDDIVADPAGFTQSQFGV